MVGSNGLTIMPSSIPLSWAMYIAKGLLASLSPLDTWSTGTSLADLSLSDPQHSKECRMYHQHSRWRTSKMERAFPFWGMEKGELSTTCTQNWWDDGIVRANVVASCSTFRWKLHLCLTKFFERKFDRKPNSLKVLGPYAVCVSLISDLKESQRQGHCQSDPLFRLSPGCIENWDLNLQVTNTGYFPAFLPKTMKL